MGESPFNIAVSQTTTLCCFSGTEIIFLLFKPLDSYLRLADCKSYELQK